MASLYNVHHLKYIPRTMEHYIIYIFRERGGRGLSGDIVLSRKLGEMC